MRYLDRRSAGRTLAGHLSTYAGPDTVVIALPRGGVPVGFEVARALALPLGLLVVRKLGAPGNPELAVGAVECEIRRQRRDRLAAPVLAQPDHIRQ